MKVYIRTFLLKHTLPLYFKKFGALYAGLGYV
ncbi:hypothetical protein SAMN05421855_102174 [Ulvibacter litoralis]|uniref:Uncharacterized protein n=1 Tax=Ulvibacter litoralis TaxID=227084 RepID=A0A1G7EW12_9FLAO|nr:hypothetical protein SAMN05421855_102174 [Ulvibacter litoralis]